MSPSKKLQILLLTLTLVLIWGHSCMPVLQSSAESRYVLGIISPILDWFVGKGNVSEHLVRKLAHFTEFAVLGLQLFLIQTGGGCKTFLRAIKVGFFVAFFDESIQMVSGRGDQIIDVWLDIAGVCFGIAAAWLCLKLQQKRASGNTREKNID